MSKPGKSPAKKPTSTIAARTTTVASAKPGLPAPAASRSATVEAKPSQREITNQAIAEAAYFLWLKRGGNETVNWLEAETSLRNGIKS